VNKVHTEQLENADVITGARRVPLWSR